MGGIGISLSRHSDNRHPENYNNRHPENYILFQARERLFTRAPKIEYLTAEEVELPH